MGTLFSLLAMAAGLVSLGCFILVIIAMFQNNQQTLAIVCLVLLLCVGLGALIAFVFGWIRSSEWGITKIMAVWTAAILIGIVFRIAAGASGIGIGAL